MPENEVSPNLRLHRDCRKSIRWNKAAEGIAELMFLQASLPNATFHKYNELRVWSSLKVKMFPAQIPLPPD